MKRALTLLLVLASTSIVVTGTLVSGALKADTLIPQGPRARYSSEFREATLKDSQHPAFKASFKTMPSSMPKQPPVPASAESRKASLRLEPVTISSQHSEPQLQLMPSFQTVFLDRVAGTTPDNNLVFFTLNPKLQEFTQKLVDQSKDPHVAVVVMDPTTGHILSLAGKSPTLDELTLHSSFPAASLFKLVTSAAALESGKIHALSSVKFRGGTYTLNKYNYLPNAKSDRRHMSLSEALGRSCNPVFARVALAHLSPSVVDTYASYFGFNHEIPFDLDLPISGAHIPHDKFQFSRAAAGFGDVRISPIHAATLMAGLANHGIMPKPTLIDRIVSPQGKLLYRARPEPLRVIVEPETSKQLLKMMEYTTTIGTSRGEFLRNNKPILGNVRVSGKTGTLTGDNPAGMTNWFIGAAPSENPEIALAVIVVNPQGISSRASRLGRQIFQQYFD